MKTMKKIFCVFLVILMCLTSAPLSGFVGLELPEWNWKVSAAEAYTEGYYTYIVSKGEATITDVDNTSIEGDISVPSTLGGYSVTTIGWYAFDDCFNLTSVTIPDSVTTIGEYAFNDCFNLTSVTIPDSVTTIGYSAFRDCDGLTSVTIPDSVTTIGDYAFYYCFSLTSITIGDSVTTIGDYAFSNCDSLTSVTIPDSVTTIGQWAFSDCGSLTSITIPDSVKTIGVSAFGRCDSLTSITVDTDNQAYSSDGRGVLFNKKKSTLIQYPDGNTNTEYIIPNSVTTIGKSAFLDCDNLTSVTIGDSVTTIGNSAFSDCDSLTSVTIPDSVTTIGNSAFYDCDSLTSVTIPNSVTTIGYSAFSDCDSLTSVTIPDSVTTIGQSAFHNCDNLTSITIGDSVTRIGYSAFRDCDNLASVTIGDSLTTIDAYAFYFCDNLTSVTIPDSVTTIDDYAFDYCMSLTSVYYSGSEAEWNKISIGFNNIDLIYATIHYNSTGSDNTNDSNDLNDTDNTTESDTPVKVTVTGTLEEYKISTVIIMNGSEYYDYVSEITIDGNKYTIKDSTLIPITSVEDFINKKVTVDIEDGIVTTFKKNEESDDDNNGFGENDGSGSNGNPDTKPQIIAYDTLVEYKQNVDFDKRKKFTINGKIINYNKEHTLTDISITIKSPDANKAVFKTENGYEASVTFPLGETIEAGKDRDFKCTAYIKRGYNPPNGMEDLTFTCILHGKLNGKEINGVYRTFNVKIKNLSYESQDDKNWTPTSLIGLLDILFTSKTPKGNLYIDCYPNKSAASTLKWQYTSIKATNAITSTIELSDELSKRLDVAIKLTELGNISALKINDVVLGIGEEALDQVMDAYQDKAMNEIKKFYDGEIKRLLESKEYKEYLEWYSREVNHINGNSIKVTKKCPIDIYVTDEEGCNILKIEDSYIKVFDEYASAYLSGDEKIMYLPNDIGHSIKTVATDNGEMDYIIESYSKQGEYRIIEYDNIPLTKGKSYTATVPLDMTSNIEMFNPKSEDGKIIKADKDETEHKYGDKDKNCQLCGFDRTQSCSCNCHKNGIAKFFFKFILFFQKLFKANKICKCGINHY